METAGEFAEKYSRICVEDLNLKAMHRLWGRKISDLGHGQFVNILKYQCSKTGTTVVEIPRFYPSSKTCSNCGYVLDDLPLSVREWTCPE
jgi:putative transposase